MSDHSRRQWRFMWKHAVGDEVGAQWRDAPPTESEVAEWLVDFAPGAVWVETRVVIEGEPERCFYDDLAPHPKGQR